MAKHVQPMDNQRVLLIEQSHYIREALQDTFRAHDIALSCVESAEAGIHAMSLRYFNAVICNYHLPGINGLEFFWNIKNLLDHVTGILTVSSGDDYLANAALESGVDYFMEMPFRVEDLVRCLSDGKPALDKVYNEFGFLANIQSYCKASQLRQQALTPLDTAENAPNGDIRTTRVINKSGGTLKVFHNDKTIKRQRNHQPNLRLIKSKRR